MPRYIDPLAFTRTHFSNQSTRSSLGDRDNQWKAGTIEFPVSTMQSHGRFNVGEVQLCKENLIGSEFGFLAIKRQDSTRAYVVLDGMVSCVAFYACLTRATCSTSVRRGSKERKHICIAVSLTFCRKNSCILSCSKIVL